MPRKVSIEECKQLAIERGGECLSKEYKNCYTKMLWKCEKGHEWQTNYTNILHKGTWCPTCGDTTFRAGDGRKRSNKKYTIENLKKIAKDKGGKCLSEEYLGFEFHHKWQCKCGYIFNATFANITKGRWCAKCSGNYISSETEVRGELNNIGIELLSNYTKVVDTIKVKHTECGNVWNTKLNYIRSGTGCPNCCLAKTQKILANLLKKIYSNSEIKTNFRGFDWLKTSKNGKMEIDILIKDNSDFSLAVEYDGEQHFRPVCFGGVSKKKAVALFNRTKQLDRLKEKRISENRDDIKYFIRFNYKDTITYDAVLEKLKLNSIPIFEEKYEQF